MESPQTRVGALICEPASSNTGSVLTFAPAPDASIPLSRAERALLLRTNKKRPDGMASLDLTKHVQ